MAPGMAPGMAPPGPAYRNPHFTIPSDKRDTPPNPARCKRQKVEGAKEASCVLALGYLGIGQRAFRLQSLIIALDDANMSAEGQGSRRSSHDSTLPLSPRLVATYLGRHLQQGRLVSTNTLHHILTRASNLSRHINEKDTNAIRAVASYGRPSQAPPPFCNPKLNRVAERGNAIMVLNVSTTASRENNLPWPSPSTRAEAKDFMVASNPVDMLSINRPSTRIGVVEASPMVA